VLPFFHENLSGDLIGRVLREFLDVAERNCTESVPVSYRPYILSLAHDICGAPNDDDVWYRLDDRGHFAQFLADKPPQTLFHYLYRRARSLPPSNPMASWDSLAQVNARSLNPADIHTPQGMRAYHRAIVNASWRRQQTIGPHGTLLPGLFMNSTASAILYDNYDSDAPEDDESRVCNHCARTHAFCTQVQARMSRDPEDDAAVLLNGSCVDCYVQSRTNCSFGKFSMFLQALALLTGCSCRPYPASAPDAEL
jgi:hypothetical protein